MPGGGSVSRIQPEALPIRRPRWFAAAAVAALLTVATLAASAPARADVLTPAWSPVTDFGSLYSVTTAIGARAMWAEGYTGEGIGVALIDSGTVPVQGLQGQVIAGPDLSFESLDTNVTCLDTFGHGTHLAGIIAGRDPGPWPLTGDDPNRFLGVAPGAKVISLKVAACDGAVDVTQVLAAIDWVVAHRDDKGLNIRVLCLAFGTDSLQPADIDPLTYAVEQAWLKGIVVVVSAGNSGSRGVLNDPATNPYVIAVGASDMHGTYDSGDDAVPSWSSRGNAARTPDLVAPGKSIVSLRNPGCAVDQEHPEARVGDRFFRGSGTSQAAAVVAGAAALLIQEWPDLRPDGVKAMLTSSADPLPGADRASAGAGAIDLFRAQAAGKAAKAEQKLPKAQGTGSLEAARGSNHVADNGVELVGEQDIFGHPWIVHYWTDHSHAGNNWQLDKTGLSWNGNLWLTSTGKLSASSTSDLSGRSWSGRSWSGRSWSGCSWSGRSWSNNTWTGRSWSGRSWSGRSWSAGNWSGRSWSTCGWAHD